MAEQYIAGDWERVRKDEMADMPRELTTHPDFLAELDGAAFSAAFSAVRALFERIYDGVIADPGAFGLPVWKIGEYTMGPEYNDARFSADRPFYLLLYLFGSGRVEGGRFHLDLAGFRKANTGTRAVPNVPAILAGLTRYGFVFEGLKDGVLPRGAGAVTIAYPENPDILTVLHLLAAKCTRFLDRHGFIRFRTLNPRLLAEPLDALGFGDGAEHVADSVHDAALKDAIMAFHGEMAKRGYLSSTALWQEGPFIRYYEKKVAGAYLFEIMKNRSRVTLRLRIRDAEACMDYLASCPESVKEMFRRTDPGCDRRRNGTCVSSTRYSYEGEEKWRCGCWGAPFFAPLDPENYPHYLELVSRGKAKRT